MCKANTDIIAKVQELMELRRMAKACACILTLTRYTADLIAMCWGF